MKKSRNSRFAATAVIALLSVITWNVSAQTTATWTGGGGDALYSNAANWDLGAVQSMEAPCTMLSLLVGDKSQVSRCRTARILTTFATKERLAQTPSVLRVIIFEQRSRAAMTGPSLPVVS